MSDAFSLLRELAKGLEPSTPCLLDDDPLNAALRSTILIY